MIQQLTPTWKTHRAPHLLAPVAGWCSGLPAVVLGIAVLVLAFHAPGYAAAETPPATEAATSDEERGETTSQTPRLEWLEVGFDGYFKPGQWIPLRADVSGFEAEVLNNSLAFAEVPDPDGVPVRYPLSLEIAPAANESASASAGLSGLVRFGRTDSALRLVLVPRKQIGRKATWSMELSPGEPTENQRFRSGISNNRPLLLELASGETGTRRAARMPGFAESESPLVIAVPSWDNLPVDWLGYEAVSTVVFAPGEEPALLPRLPEHRRQLSALQNWLHRGGTMLIAAGGIAEEHLQPDSPITAFLPGAYRRRYRLREAPALEAFCRAETELAIDQTPLDAVVLQAEQGIVEAREADLALIVRSPFGLGRVVYTAIDLTAPALAAWSDQGHFVSRLLNYSTELAPPERADQSLMHFGYSDLSGQLRSALEDFPGVARVPFLAVAGLMGVYLLVVGPGDWWLVRKVFRSQRIGWLTLPVWIALAIAVGIFLGVWGKGEQGRINEVILVDYDAAENQVRGTAWGDVFSPTTDRYDFTYRPPPVWQTTESNAEAGVAITWQGLPGRGLGGMDSRTVERQPWELAYRTSRSGSRLEGTPIPRWTTKTFLARWWRSEAPPVSADLSDRDRLAYGSITNNSDAVLVDCLLTYGSWVYQIGQLEPGRSIQIGPGAERRELTTWLTGRRVVIEGPELTGKLRETTSPYDQSSRDVHYIMRMMMFYEAAGGEAYTRLNHTYQGYVDGSRWLKDGRAVFVGRVETEEDEASEWGGLELPGDKTAGVFAQRRKTVYVRCVWPVR